MDRYAVEKRAVLHVHTEASDGTGTMEEIIAEALAADVDVIGINDHRTLHARDRGWSGWHSSVFVLAGSELEDADENSHILAYGIDSLPGTSVTSQQLNFIAENGGIAIAAHPAEAPGRLPKTRSYSWKSASMKGLAGVEVWNYMSLWKKGISPFNSVARIRHPDRYVEHPNPGAIDIWERVGGCAVAGPDAHALRFGFGRMRFEVFPYSMLFRRLFTHILLEEEMPDDWRLAESKLMQALREGSCFTSNLLLGDARGFRAEKENGNLWLNLPGAGDVTLANPGGILWQGELDQGEHNLPLTGDEPISIFVTRKEKTWIYCGIPQRF